MIKRLGAMLALLSSPLLGQSLGVDVPLYDASKSTQTRPFAVYANVGALPSTGCVPGSYAEVTSAGLYRNTGTGTCVWAASGGGGSGTALAPNVVTPSFSTTITLNCGSTTAATLTTFEIPQLSNNTTLSVGTCTPGQQIRIQTQQAASGGPYQPTMPSGFAACPTTTIASLYTYATYIWDGTSGGLVSCVTTGSSTLTESAMPSGSPVATQEFFVADSTALFPRAKNSSGVTFQMAKEITGLRYAGGAGVADAVATATQVAAAQSMPTCANDGAHALTYPSAGTYNCTSVGGGGSAYVTTGNSAITPGTSGDVIFVASGSLPAIPAGACYDYETFFTNPSQSANANSVKLWFGASGGMTVGSLYSAGSSLATGITGSGAGNALIYWTRGQICNNNGSTTAQTASAFTLWDETGQGVQFAKAGSMAQNTASTLQIGLSANWNVPLTVQSFRVWRTQ